MPWRPSCEVGLHDNFLFMHLLIVVSANTTAEQKARLLESKIAANVDTIEHLRHERSLLSADHKDLQQRYKQLSEVTNRGFLTDW